MKILKIMGLVSFGVVLFKACQMNYISDVVDSIPAEIRLRIIDENPQCRNMDTLAEYWQTKGDSLVDAIAKEQECAREWDKNIDY